MQDRPLYFPEGLTFLEDRAIDLLLADLNEPGSANRVKAVLREQQRVRLAKLKALLQELGNVPSGMWRFATVWMCKEITKIMEKCLGINDEIMSRLMFRKNKFSDFQMRRLILSEELIPFIGRLIKLCEKEHEAILRYIKYSGVDREFDEINHDKNIERATAFCERFGRVAVICDVIRKEEYERAMKDMAARLRREFKGIPSTWPTKDFDLIWQVLELSQAILEEKVKFNQKFYQPLMKVFPIYQIAQGPLLHARPIRFSTTPELQFEKQIKKLGCLS